VFWIAVDEATTPANGECIVNNWWTVHPVHGLAFYAQLHGYAANEAPSPQCNQSESTAKFLGGKLWPDHRVEQIPVVFMAHAEKAMRKLKAQGIAARSDKTGTGLAEGKSPVAKPCAQTPVDLSSRDTNNVG